MFAVRPRAWDAPPAEGFDALLFGSANVLRHGGDALRFYRHLPVHAVGSETADVAREAGFDVARVGAGGLQALLDEAAEPLRYLRLAGAAHVELEPPPGTMITMRVIYESVPLVMPGALAARLREGALVLIHSGEAARHFAAECDRLALARARIALAALAPRIAHEAGDGWARIGVALQPRDSTLLALALDMCQEGIATRRGQ